MNDLHMMTLANDSLVDRRAEADRERLARSARAARTTHRANAAEASSRPGRSLGALLHRMASL